MELTESQKAALSKLALAYWKQGLPLSQDTLDWAVRDAESEYARAILEYWIEAWQKLEDGQ